MSNSRPLAPVEGHDVDHLLARLTLTIHNQAHMIEESGEVFEFRERVDQLLQVLQPAGAGGRAVLLPHLGVAGFVEHPADDLGMRRLGESAAPAAKLAD